MGKTTPNISDVISSEMEEDNSTLQIKNEEPTETPKEEVAEVQPEEPAKEEEAKETKETEPKVEEETFTTFNPKDLTPELQLVYKKWQSDYTQKRQGEKKELQTLKDRIAELEQPSNKAQAEKINDFNNAKASGEINPNMSFQEYSRLLIDQAKQEFKNEYKTDQENDYIENQEKEFMNLDPRFQEGPSFNKILLNHVASELASLRETFEKENDTIIGFDFIGESKKLIADYDTRIEQSNKTFVEKQNKLVKDKTLESNLKNPKTKTKLGDSGGNMKFEDAFNDAYSKN